MCICLVFVVYSYQPTVPTPPSTPSPPLGCQCFRVFVFILLLYLSVFQHVYLSRVYGVFGSTHCFHTSFSCQSSSPITIKNDHINPPLFYLYSFLYIGFFFCSIYSFSSSPIPPSPYSILSTSLLVFLLFYSYIHPFIIFF